MILQRASTPTMIDGSSSLASDNTQDGTPPPSTTDVLSNSGAGANGTEVLVAVWVMTVVATTFLAMRVFVKFRGHKGLWWDDNALLASWVMLLGFSSVATYCVTVGLGSHTQSSKVQQTPLQLGVVIATVFSTLSAAWSKTSFAITLLRITREGSRVIYWAIWCVIVTMNVVLVFNAIIGFIWCDPPQAAWNANISGKCWDRAIVVRYSIFGAAYSAAMDFLLAMVPWLVIMKLSMRKKEKLGVVFCMSLGIFAGCTSIMRAVTVPSLYSGDYTYEAGRLFIWTGAELATTIVAASIPILRALLSDMVRSRSPPRKTLTELNTFRSLRDEGGIRVTHTTTVTRTPSKRLLEQRQSPDFHFDTENLLKHRDSIPVSPGPTYHSFVQKY